MSFLDLSDLGFASSSSELYALWLQSMQTQVDGYVPAPASLENIHASIIALLASDVAQTGVVVPDAIFRMYGTKLVGVAYEAGVSARTVLQVVAVDTAGHTLDANTSLTLSGLGFFTTQNLVIAPGSTTGTVIVTAAATGIAYNGAQAPAELAEQIDWVQSVSALTPASLGVDPEDDATYQDRLTGQLRLQAPRPITASDFAQMLLSFPPASGTDQQEIGRATAIDGYNSANAVFTVSTTSGSPNLTVTTAPALGVTAVPGATITGAGIPGGTSVLSATTSTIVISANATATATGVAATVAGSNGNARYVTAFGTLADGTALNADTLAASQTWLDSFREEGFIVNVLNPTYQTIYVTFSIHPYPDFDPTSIATATQAAVINFLSPQNFGLPPFGEGLSWLNDPVIRYDKLIGVIQAVRGVDYVVAGSLKVGTGASPTGTTDLKLTGPAALPQSTTTSVPLPTVV